MMRSRPWKEYLTPAERLADKRMLRVLYLQEYEPMRVARWDQYRRRVCKGYASTHRTAGGCRWRRLLRIKRLIRGAA